MLREVRRYWEREPCGTSPTIVGALAAHSIEWFERIEEHRYRLEPFIHSVAQFTRHRGKDVLEVGVGAGTDHLQWVRAGARCVGVDLTVAALDTTRRRLAAYGFDAKLQRVDAEMLPFPTDAFDVVYSWGVIHHTERPERIVAEIQRVLRPGGVFIGMVYGRHSPLAVRLWIRNALLRGRPWRSLRDVIWHHMESVGTQAYTEQEVRTLFRRFGACVVRPYLTEYDREYWPRWLGRFFPDDWGWFITVRATK